MRWRAATQRRRRARSRGSARSRDGSARHWPYRPRGRSCRRSSGSSSFSGARTRTRSPKGSVRPSRSAPSWRSRCRCACCSSPARRRSSTSTSEPPMNGSGPTIGAARRWFLAALGTAVALLAAVGGFNAWIDPFQQYRLAETYPPRFYTSFHRYIAPGLAKHARYDTLLSGSSIVENTRNSAIGRACGGTGLNVAMPALTASEQALIVSTALAAKPLVRVSLVLDFSAFSGAPDQRNPLAGPMPAYFYDRNPANDFPYVLPWGVLVRSWRIVRGDASERFRSDPDAPWWWADEKRFGREEVVRRLDPRDLNAQFQQPLRDLAGMQASFTRNLLPLLRAHSATEFDLVWPPYSIVVWADFVERRQLDVSLDFKRWVFAT